MSAAARTTSDREILGLALPATGSGLTVLAHLAIDTWWIGQLEHAEAALAALSIATFTRWIFSAIALLPGVGITALVARYAGAGRGQVAAWVAAQGVAGALVLSLLTAVLGWFLAPLIFSLVSDSPAVVAAGMAYMRVYWLGGAAVLLERSCEAVFRARGNTRTPLLLAAASLVVNAILDPLLLFGFWVVPPLGVGGVALATVLASAFAGGASFAILAHRGWLSRAAPLAEDLRLDAHTRVGSRRWLGLDPVLLWRMTRVGLPILQGGVFFAVIYLVIGALVGETGGAAAQAALGIGHRGEAFAYVLASGFSVAASSLVGRWLGARDAAAAEHAAWRTVAHCAAYCGIWALVLLVFGDAIASLFLETGTDAHALATSYYRITALCLVPQAFQIVLDGAAGGAGKTLPPMVVMVTASLLRVALAWVVAVPLGLGIDAIWWVLAITAILRGIAMTVWFRRGTWKSQSV